MKLRPKCESTLPELLAALARDSTIARERPAIPAPLSQEEALDMIEAGKRVEEVLAEFERRLERK